MRIRKPGKISDRLWYLGREESGVYLLEGNTGSVMINGGLSCLIPDILKQVKDFGIDMGKIKSFLILHSHFDHIGIAPYFKRNYPGIEFFASKRSWEILQMPKAIAIANEYSKIVAKHMGADAGLDKFDPDWRDDLKGNILSEGDRIDLGGITLNILETPGHTSCSITAYEPQMKALFASDAVNIPYRDTAFPSGNTDYTQFQKTLERLRSLPVNLVCCDHYGYVSGEEAGRYIDVSVKEAAAMRSEMENILGKQGDIDSAAKTITSLFYQKNPDYFISAEILEGVFKQIAKHLAKNM